MLAQYESLSQLYLATGRDKVMEAIARIRQYEPPDGYFLANSYGKDSGVLHDLALKAGVKFQAYYCRTGIDPPEAIQFGRQTYPEVIELPPLMTMWAGILIHGLPLRHRRWCCQVLKEHAGEGKVILQGIRWEESARRRRQWDVYSPWNPNIGSKSKRTVIGFVSPLIDWSTHDIWEYIHHFQLPYCCLYDEGFTRLGCVLCPFSHGATLRMEIERYPKIVDAYRRAATRYFERRKDAISNWWSSGDDYFEWWLKERLGGIL